MPASDDAGEPSQAEILAKLRELRKNAPKPNPPTPEERAEAEAQNARLWETFGWQKFKQPLHIPEFPITEVEPEPLGGPLEVVVIDDRRGAPLEPQGDPGRPEIRVTQQTLFGLFERGLERARSTKKRRRPTYDEIAAEYGLKRTWMTPIVKWAETHQREAREAIVTSKTPRRFSTLIRD